MKRSVLRVSVVLCVLVVVALGTWWAWQAFWSADQFRAAVMEGIGSVDFSKADKLKAWSADTGPWRKEVSGRQLLESVKAGEEKRVEALLILGAMVDAKDTFGKPALHFAAINDNLPIAKLLLAHGANVDIKGTGGWTPLHLTAASLSPAVAKLLLIHGADPNVKDTEGKTPINLWHELAEIVKEVEAEKAGKKQPAQPKVVTP